MQPDGVANINCINGSVVFWFNPDWNGGSKTNTGVFLEMGATNSANGWWALWCNASGTSLYFETQSNSSTKIYFTNSISGWQAGTWYQIVLTYSTNGTALYTNGAFAQAGPPITDYPTINQRLNYGFSIGSDHTGQNQSAGLFNQVATYNNALTVAEVTSNYNILDANELPDWWQLQYFGSLNVNPYADPENDG